MTKISSSQHTGKEQRQLLSPRMTAAVSHNDTQLGFDSVVYPQILPCLVPNKHDIMTAYQLELFKTHCVVISDKKGTVKAKIQLTPCHIRLLPAVQQKDAASGDQGPAAQASKTDSSASTLLYPAKISQASGHYRVIYFKNEELRQMVLSVALAAQGYETQLD